MKKCLSVILVIVLVLSITPTALASSDVRVTLDGQQIVFDVPPQIIDDRTMVPLRAIFE
ncbi:MAG: copper amine oxidase N-terminal domain-containing protein, partial [Tannerella sp.]|nr:copper amine oxidase N-terminal domain-containing protein [Tannerella sp.]